MIDWLFISVGECMYRDDSFDQAKFLTLRQGSKL